MEVNPDELPYFRADKEEFFYSGELVPDRFLEPRKADSFLNRFKFFDTFKGFFGAPAREILPESESPERFQAPSVESLFERGSWLMNLINPAQLFTPAAEASSLDLGLEQLSAVPTGLPNESTITAGVIERGRATFEAEGNEGGPFQSRKPHVPGKGLGGCENSGVTIGRGFDVGQFQRREVRSILNAAGFDPQFINSVMPFVGVKGTAAQAMLDCNPPREITPEEQVRLFNVVYSMLEADTERLCTKDDVREKYGAVDWNALPEQVKKYLIDLRFRGDFSPTTREHIMPLLVAGDYEGLARNSQIPELWSPSLTRKRMAERLNILRS
jgi:hypothetical protein